MRDAHSIFLRKIGLLFNECFIAGLNRQYLRYAVVLLFVGDGGDDGRRGNGDGGSVDAVMMMMILFLYLYTCIAYLYSFICCIENYLHIAHWMPMHQLLSYSNNAFEFIFT